MKFEPILLGAAALSLSGCGGGSSGQGGADQASSDWQFSQTVDALTDAKIDTASGNVGAGDYDVETEISCINGEIGRYRFTFTQTLGMPAPMRIQVGRSAFGGGVVSGVVLASRADGGRIRLVNASNLQQDNVLVLVGSTPNAVAASFNAVSPLIAANKFTLRVPMAEGEATFTIDQTDPVIAKALAACSTKMRQALSIERDDAAAVDSSEQAEGGSVGISDQQRARDEAYAAGASAARASGGGGLNIPADERRRAEEAFARADAETERQNDLEAERLRREMEELNGRFREYANTDSESDQSEPQ